MQTITIHNQPLVELDVQQAAGDPRIELDGLDLPDGSLIDCELDDLTSVTVAFAVGVPSLSISVAHQEDGALLSWNGPSHEFETTQGEVTLLITIVAATTTTRTLKVKVRPRTEKPGTPFVLD